jgi:hypothetical protein
MYFNNGRLLKIREKFLRFAAFVTCSNKAILEMVSDKIKGHIPGNRIRPSSIP